MLYTAWTRVLPVLYEANLSKVDMTGADLTRANLSEADLDGVIGADFSGAKNAFP